MNIFKLSCILFVLVQLTCGQDFSNPNNEQRLDICPGRSGSLNCAKTPDTNFTAVVTEAFYGIKSTTNTDICEYKEGDCYTESTTNYCVSYLDTCSVSASSSYKVPNCNNADADYLHLRYKCLPVLSTKIKSYNICDNTVGDITDSYAHLNSPQFPLYTMVTQECTKKIVAPSDKIINVWFVSIDMKSAGTNQECITDYVKVTDNTGVYSACGYRKLSLQNKLCSSTIYVSYLAPANLSPTIYRGFRLYYEFIDRSTQPGCPTNIPTPPPTPLFTTTQPPLVTDLSASGLKSVYVCRGNETFIEIPKDFTLFPIEAYYGVTNDQFCTSISQQDCKAPYTLSCGSSNGCLVSFYNSFVLNDCGGRIATYINIKYRLIPLITTRNQTLCDNSDINGTSTTYGVITNPGYPIWTPNQNCKRKIVAPLGRVISVFISDINIEESDPNDNQCKQGYLGFNTECDAIKYCGKKTSTGGYIYTSCSNVLTISYVSTTSNYDLRGFNLYWEVTNLDSASPELKTDACAGAYADLKCQNTAASNFTPVVTTALSGINTANQSSCVFNENNCYAAYTSSLCAIPSATCSAYASTVTNLPNCGNIYAKYLHVRYRCIPIGSAVLPNFNICDNNLKDITEAKGFISSPNYPVYTMVPNDCTQRIVAPMNKVINMWISADMKSSDSNQVCSTDYIKITDNTGTYSVCGYRKYSFEGVFCSSTIYVSYKAPASLSTAYRGIRIYYEFVDRSTQPDCSTAIPGPPTTPIPTTTNPQLVYDLTGSDIRRLTICRGNETTITIPTGFNIFILDVYYGVTPDQTCTTINPQNCKSPGTLSCTTGSCKVSLLSDVILTDCQNKIANYVALTYRFLPLSSTRNTTICDNSDVNATALNYGVITSPSYPTWEQQRNCQRKIVAPVGKFIRVYVNDIKIEPTDPNDGDCKNGYLSMTSDCGSVKYCDEKVTGGSYVFTSCSNTLTLSYVATTSDQQLRGFNVYYETISPEIASPEYRLDICPGSTKSVTCESSITTNFTPIANEALYGIQSTPSTNTCEYKDNDCYASSTTNYCITAIPTCSFSSSSTQLLAGCNNKTAQYLHVRYKCVPAASVIIPEYNICDKTLGVITDQRAFISSPSYPTYQMVPNDCTVKIVAPSNKIINIWLVAVDMKSATSNECTDYIKISDNTGTYNACGYRKFSFDNRLCSSQIYVSYLAISNLTVTLYKGFRLYYELIDRVTQPYCPTNTPASPTTPRSTTTTTPFLTDISASAIMRQYACLGTETVIQVPRRYRLFPISVYYGVTGDNTCKTINPQNCKSPTTLNCKLDEDCKISLYNSIPVNDCGGKVANYIGIEYRLIPLYTTRNISMCVGAIVDGSVDRNGVITSPNYPNWQANQNCEKQIIAPAGRIIRVYISDLGIEKPDSNDQCNDGVLTLSSDCENGRQLRKPFCGDSAVSGIAFETCSNVLKISYRTSPGPNSQYRGFNLYFEVSNPVNASVALKQDICASNSVTLKCESNALTNYTILVNEAFYGVKQPSSTYCGYKDGDCYSASTTTYCTSLTDSCSITASSSTTLSKCNKTAEYLHVRYRCVPFSSGVLKTYDICDKTLTALTDSNGFIQSPGYPSYSIVPNECILHITAPNDKIIRVWFPDVYIKTSEPNNDCKTDYIKVVDSTGVYKSCGNKKYSFESRLCSSQIYIEYKAPTNSTVYRGFKLYYEFADRSTQPGCPVGTPPVPTEGSVVTGLPTVGDYMASEIQTAYACKGSETSIPIKDSNFVIFQIAAYYGYTPDNTCNSINEATDCTSPAQYTCSSSDACVLSLYNEVELDGCNNAIANYIALQYRFIPLYSAKNFSVCNSDDIDGSKDSYGVITSPNYPNSIPTTNELLCTKKITSPRTKGIRVYLTDLSMPPPEDGTNICAHGFVSIGSTNTEEKFCGGKNEGGSYVFTSCDNNLTIQYVSSKDSELFRGFNIYYEVIERGDISCPSLPPVTVQPTKYVTVVNQDHKSRSHALIGWTLGLGLPAIIVIVAVAFYFQKRSKSNNSEATFAFSKINEDEDTKAFTNKNYS